MVECRHYKIFYFVDYNMICMVDFIYQKNLSFFKIYIMINNIKMFEIVCYIYFENKIF